MNESPVSMWVHGALPEGVAGVLGRLSQTPGVVRVAVMPDVHLAGEFCVGTVVASRGVLFPNAVGGDIGCGMLAVRFDIAAEALQNEQTAARMLGALCELCPGRRHHRKTTHEPSPELRAMEMASPQLEAMKNGSECRSQLGTLGAGNHFLEWQSDENGQLWLMLHTGSRHLGQEVLHHYLPKAQRLESGVMALDVARKDGHEYTHDMEISRAWAKENRRLLAEGAKLATERVLGARMESETFVDCDHNHVMAEMHDG